MASHLSLEVIKLCATRNIRFVLLLTTTKCDPPLSAIGSGVFSYQFFYFFFKTQSKLRLSDKAFSLHYNVNDDQLKIGNYPVNFLNNNLHVADNNYPWTFGLWSLLCEKTPRGSTLEEVEAY